MLRELPLLLFYLFRSDRTYFFSLIRLLGFVPGKVSLYRTALTHKSASIVLNDGSRINNERLEYLGDAILGSVAAEFIFSEFRDSDEGFMTKLRARIVKRKNLDAMAVKMGIPELIASHPHPANTSKHLYGNALEALIGAIYLDRGYAAACRFFRKRMIRRYMDLTAMVKKDSDYKSQIIEWAQKNKQELIFESEEENPDNHEAPSFKSSVMLNERTIGSGKGGSKKEAEQQAAKIALKEITP